MTELSLTIDEHPLLDLRALEVRFPAPLGEVSSPEALTGLLSLEAEAPLERDEETRAAARRLLRRAGFRPSGRNKPASEYLIRAAGSGYLRSINLAADLGNAVSLHSGLPLSVVDPDKAKPPLRVEVAAPEASFVFNAAGQEIKVGKLLGLSDADGPCANAVKDAQRTKTDEGTRRVLVLIWGSVEVPGLAGRAADWLTALAADAGAEVRPL